MGNKTDNTPNTPRNFVHKHGLEFNTAKVYDDRKKRNKRGYRKHKGGNDAPFDFSGK